jgi:hypothetical protein
MGLNPGNHFLYVKRFGDVIDPANFKRFHFGFGVIKRAEK